MKKINKIEFKINIKKNKFDIDMKHDFSPIKVLMVGNKILAEYAMLMMQNEESGIFNQSVYEMTERLENLGDIKLTIEEYESNTFKFSKQVIHEVKYDKEYTLKDVFAIISVSMTYIKDTLVTSYGIDNKIYEMPKDEAISLLAEFEKSLEMYKRISDMYGIAGYVYKNFEDSMENLVSNMAYMSEICGDIADSFVDEGQDIFLVDEEDSLNENDAILDDVEESYERIMGMFNAAINLHNGHSHHHDCGCEDHHHDCGCEDHNQDCGCEDHHHDCGCEDHHHDCGCEDHHHGCLGKEENHDCNC